MDELAWLVVVLLAFPVMALVGLILSLKQRTRLRMLEARVAQLEAAMATQTVAEPVFPEPARAAPVRQPSPPAPEQVTRAARPPRARLGSQWNLSRLRENFSGIEEKIGARWAVWVGGLALALGGVFLVRFAVEQNLIGPAGRIGLGLALALALLAAGEALRRLDLRQSPAATPPQGWPQVPGLLTAIGTMTAFGSLYAAHELYHLISPPVAVALLGLTGAGTVLAALLHGPALAALGFAGAAVTPFLVGSDEPNAWGVALLIIMVGAAALVVARIRLWRWFAALAVAGMGAWGFTLLLFAVPQAVPAAGALALALLALTAGLLTPDHLLGPPGGERPDPVATLGAALALAVAAFAAQQGETAALPLLVFIIAALGALALAWRAPAATFAALTAALTAPVILAAWAFPPLPATSIAPAGPLAGAVPEPAPLALASFALYGFLMGLLLAGIGVAGAWRARRDLFGLGWAAAGTAGPLLLLIAAYGRLTELDRSLPFAVLALALAALFTAASEGLSRLRQWPAAAAFATGGVVSLALALAFALEKGWLTVGLALAALGGAWASTQRPLPGLRQLSAGLGLVVLARVGWDPTIAGTDLGTLPILNWLLWGYGVPALAFAGAARLLARGGDDWSRRVLESLALVFAILLAALEVRHLAHGGDVFAAGTRLFETGLLAALYGAYAVGLSRLATVTGRAFYRLFADLVAALAAVCALAALTADNPFMTGQSVGGVVFNDLLVAYALPAGLALLYAAGLPPERRRLRLGASALAVVLALAYATFQVSRLFQGPVLSADRIGAMEWYAYSATWLAFGIVLLGLGLWQGSRSLRLASAAVTIATVLKVFISDMADLEGMLRAVSFIGLGVVLVAMGWLYQRLLAHKGERGASRREDSEE
ncbi:MULTISPECIES: DUF2339 domain-containing protein [unclassified Xanthobacter]|uniref:DUF2339 domain-containing protein n=1 Tax=unclassified Xanthobacter TaxID=2623496 RepID=UPI001F15C530|nr:MULTISPECIES: DUF2339 domain-containing protein [unclassified Xanthobacter]